MSYPGNLFSNYSLAAAGFQQSANQPFGLSANQITEPDNWRRFWVSVYGDSLRQAERLSADSRKK